MDTKKLKRLAQHFRAAIVACDKNSLPATFTDFPNGACGDTTLLLRRFLQEHGFRGFEYMHGLRGRCTHAWLQHDSTVVDITADQFADNGEAVIVRKGSRWHAQFNGQLKRNADLESYDDRTQHSLLEAYKAVVAHIPDI